MFEFLLNISYLALFCIVDTSLIPLVAWSHISADIQKLEELACKLQHWHRMVVIANKFWPTTKVKIAGHKHRIPTLLY